MKRMYVTAAACLIAAATGWAELAVETWAVGGKATHPRTLKLSGAAGGGTVIDVDLSALPKGAKVRRARLLVQRGPVTGSDAEARVACEVLGLLQGERGRARPSAEAKPLPIAGPWHDHFDATDVARAWASGVRSGAVLVKSLPKWLPQATRLEIDYEGTGRKAPRQVTGLKAVHRAGQTFLTWKEIDDPFGERAVKWGELRERLAKPDEPRCVRYRVYRHSRPITKDTIAEATLLAEVRPLSGFNANAWSKERLINQVVFGDDDKGELGKYNPFRGWDRDSEPGGRLIIPRFVVPGSDRPLPAGTGLYVHSATKDEQAWYAVCVSVDGTVNAADFSKANSAGAVAEKVAAWEPVLQSAGAREFGFDFPGRKQFYVTWVAPPLSNVPRYFNWSVHLPPELTGAAPMNVSFHDLGFSYAKPVRRYDRRAVQIAGHDFDPVTGWYGYHEHLGTLRSWSDGAVQPYTERRVLAFMDFAARQWKIDPRRCFTDGRGMGGLGASHFACKHAERFAYVLNDRGAVCCRDADALPALEDAWGRVAWGLKNDRGVNVWQWQDLTWYVRRQGPGQRLPVLSLSPWGHTAWQDGYPRRTVGDRNKRWMQSHVDHTRFFQALMDNKHMLFADFDWGPTLGILPQWMDVTTGPVPVVTNSSDKKIRQTDDGPFIFFEPSGSSPSGWIHWHHRWDSDAVDEPERLELTLYVTGGEVTADVTPRGAEKFRPRPGEKLKWTNTHLAEGDPRDWGLRNVWQKYPKKQEIQNGTVAVDEHGLVTIPGVIVLPTKCRLAIRR